jgi:hypothetical protein
MSHRCPNYISVETSLAHPWLMYVLTMEDGAIWYKLAMKIIGGRTAEQ